MLIDGFFYAAVEAGIRKKNRLDLALIFSETPAEAAGVFTTSRVQAAPVVLGRKRLHDFGKAQAILINSGIANACTGEPGMIAALACSRLVADALKISENLVQVSSTGVIGEQLTVERFAVAIPGLVGSLEANSHGRVAKAMMTTDTVPKTASREVEIQGKKVRIFGMTKGAGMIMPNMATMLCYVMTDAAVTAGALQDMLLHAVDGSFNRITVDGDTSTNDTVLVLANGRAGNVAINSSDSEGGKALAAALGDLLLDLALQIVKDGEGATKLVTVRVVGAENDRDADAAARTIGNSALVKTAFFGEDANWGRIIAALGRSGIEIDPARVAIFFDDVQMVKNGLGQGTEAEKKATEVLKKKDFEVVVDLGMGTGQGHVYTSDFSIDYVKINADYRS